MAETGSRPLPPNPSPGTAMDWPWLALLVVVGVGVLLLRASMLSTFFVDEAFTVGLVNRTPEQLIALTAFDAHPPGYYLMLKAWLKPWRVLLGEPGLMTYRSLGIVAWIGFSLAAWFGLRHHLGRVPGSVAAAIILTSTHVMHVAAEARQYSVVLPALFLCWLMMVTAWRREREGRSSFRHSALLWSAYAGMASLAMWSQFLAGFHLMVMGLLWLAISLREAGWRSRFFRHGLAAQAVAVLLFLPWVPMIPYSLGHLDLFPRSWQTPATPLTYLGAFLFWLPMGAQPWHPWPYTNWLFSLALAIPLVPLLAWRLGRAGRVPARSTPSPDAEWAFQVAGFSLLLALGYVFVIWFCAAVGIANMYHAPRYPMHALPAWVVFMVWVSARVVEARGWPGRAHWWMAAPWFAAALGGQVSLFVLHEHQQIPWAVEQARAVNAWNDDGRRDVYVSPGEMLPLVRGLPGMEGARPLGAIIDADPGRPAVVVHPSVVYWIHSPADARLLSLAWGAVLSERATIWRPHGGATGVFALTDLGMPRPEVLAQLREEGLVRGLRSVPPRAVTVATPEAQSQLMGWGMLEFADDRSLFRWGEGGRNTLRFDQPVSPGRYTLQLRGFRPPHPEEEIPLALKVLTGGTETTTSLPAGGWTLALPVEVTRDATPLIRLEMPVWRPRRHIEGVLDDRPLTIMFQVAWLEPAD